VLKQVKADDAVVVVTSTVDSNQRFAANTFTTNGQTENLTIRLTVWVNGRKGSATTSEIGEGAIKKLVEQAQQIASLSPVDQEYVPTLAQQRYAPEGVFHSSTAEPDLRRRSGRVSGILQACEKAGVVGAGLYRSVAVALGALTRNGNFFYDRRGNSSLSVTARLPDGSSSGYYLRSNIEPTKLPYDQIVEAAIDRAVRGRRAELLDPGVYSVILEPQAVLDVLSYFPAAFNARPADEGRSAMSAPGGKNRIGEQLFDPMVNFYSDPAHQELPGARATKEWVPAQKMHLIERGAVKNLAYSRFWAKEKKVQPTPGPTNYILESAGPTRTISEMIQQSKRALLVSRLWYIRMVSPRTLLVTGLTRDGVWLVENGEIKHPVRNFRFNQSLMAMLGPGNVLAMSKPEVVGGSEGPDSAHFYPALQLEKFHFTSTSEAV
jgi:predicted Zn-dependent protease